MNHGYHLEIVLLDVIFLLPEDTCRLSILSVSVNDTGIFHLHLKPTKQFNCLNRTNNQQILWLWRYCPLLRKMLLFPVQEFYKTFLCPHYAKKNKTAYSHSMLFYSAAASRKSQSLSLLRNICRLVNLNVQLLGERMQGLHKIERSNVT